MLCVIADEGSTSLASCTGTVRRLTFHNSMTSSLRNILRYSIALLGGTIAGVGAVSAIESWQQYRAWTGRDPSAAEAYLSFAATNSAVVILSVALAWLVWWLLRPSASERGR
jgi:hypothetical protein